MIYTHVLQLGPLGVHSPLDRILPPPPLASPLATPLAAPGDPGPHTAPPHDGFALPGRYTDPSNSGPRRPGR